MSARSARVRVPASCANVGAGYDCIGFAVDRWLSASVSVSAAAGARAPEVTIDRRGTLASLTVAPIDDVVMTGFAAACRSAKHSLPGRLDFELDSRIPVSRGLGSSSAALVAGALLANATLDLGLPRARIATLCTEVEGHPDNVAPAVFGGAMLGVQDDDGRWIFSAIEVHPSLAFAFVVPDVLVETIAARAILPASVPHAQAVRAVGKGAALAHGLVTGDATLLGVALDDLLHVPHRRHLVPGYDDVVAAALGAGGFGATLSGSGSTLVAISAPRDAPRVAAAMEQAFVGRGIAAESFVQERMVRVAD